MLILIDISNIEFSLWIQLLIFWTGLVNIILSFIYAGLTCLSIIIHSLYLEKIMQASNFYFCYILPTSMISLLLIFMGYIFYHIN